MGWRQPQRNNGVRGKRYYYTDKTYDKQEQRLYWGRGSAADLAAALDDVQRRRAIVRTSGPLPVVYTARGDVHPSGAGQSTADQPHATATDRAATAVGPAPLQRGASRAARLPALGTVGRASRRAGAGGRASTVTRVRRCIAVISSAACAGGLGQQRDKHPARQRQLNTAGRRPARQRQFQKLWSLVEAACPRPRAPRCDGSAFR